MMSKSGKYKIEYYPFRSTNGCWMINIKKLNMCIHFHPELKWCKVEKYRAGFFKTTVINNFVLESTLVGMLKSKDTSNYGLAFELLNIRLKEIGEKYDRKLLPSSVKDRENSSITLC
jgi:hypothetical protein